MIPALGPYDLRRIAEDPASVEWRPFRPGVQTVPLYDVGGGGPSAALLRYAPGASVPRHLHVGHEHLIILAGAQEDERGRYAAGTAIINLPGSSHSVRSPEGCVALLIWEKPVRFEL